MSDNRMGNAMSKTAKEHGGQVPRDSAAAGAQSGLNRDQTRGQAEQYKQQEMSREGDVSKGGRAAGVQSGVDQKYN